MKNEKKLNTKPKLAGKKGKRGPGAWIPTNIEDHIPRDCDKAIIASWNAEPGKIIRYGVVTFFKRPQPFNLKKWKADKHVQYSNTFIDLYSTKAERDKVFNLATLYNNKHPDPFYKGWRKLNFKRHLMKKPGGNSGDEWYVRAQK